ncbi:NADH dehydrogenase subunit 3 (mitochondrion) [Paramicrosporidium saccamoebae]|uniref:NADH-ubiquinone oxidoreductase chain 3 n=1 Tax=Paramicrosporidium saccamoebae TaxID=1246581 RepID=A0A2H9TR28_9FUNG|nr:NADH dehydrogenase subunit 3 [Paramicrosporidium saccamoebae]
MSLMIIFTICLSSFLILFSYLLSHKTNYPGQFGIVNDEGERKSQYECGLETFEEEIGIETRERFYLKFYIIGILFLIFDLETLLLFPISLLFYTPYNSLSSNTETIYIVFLIFIFILLLGLFYEFRKKIL